MNYPHLCRKKLTSRRILKWNITLKHLRRKRNLRKIKSPKQNLSKGKQDRKSLKQFRKAHFMTVFSGFLSNTRKEPWGCIATRKAIFKSKRGSANVMAKMKKTMTLNLGKVLSKHRLNDARKTFLNRSENTLKQNPREKKRKKTKLNPQLMTATIYLLQEPALVWKRAKKSSKKRKIRKINDTVVCFLSIFLLWISEVKTSHLLIYKKLKKLKSIESQYLLYPSFYYERFVLLCEFCFFCVNCFELFGKLFCFGY